jgi:DNA-binding FadR family transcriptional regulator
LLSGNIEPNSYLPSEAELCGKLGVGRTTLREAVKALESGGFVTHRHGKGRQVVDESHRATSDILQLLLKRKNASLRELLEARRIVETQAVALAADRATPRQLEALKSSLTALQSHGTSTKKDIKADLHFHLAIASATGNVLISLIFETIRPFLERTIISCLRWLPRMNGSCQESHLICNQEMVGPLTAAQKNRAARKHMVKVYLGFHIPPGDVIHVGPSLADQVAGGSLGFNQFRLQ